MDETEASPVMEITTYATKVKISGGIVVKNPGDKDYSSVEVSAFVSREYGADVDMNKATDEVAAATTALYKKNTLAYYELKASAKKS